MNKLKFGELLIYNRNSNEATEIYESIFLREDYKISINKKNPTIIDCGAHIGIATLYFKNKFPEAKITSIEANPETFKYLKKNIEANNISNVTPIWGALSAENKTKIPLYVDKKIKSPWSWDDSIIKDIWSDRPKQNNKKRIMVPTFKLSEIINTEIDLLKIDIEGAEVEVIKEAQSKLNFVKSIVMEFHPTIKTPKSELDIILNILKTNNFNVNTYPVDWAIFVKATNLP